MKKLLGCIVLMVVATGVTFAQPESVQTKTGFGVVEGQTLNVQPQINLWLQDTKPDHKTGWYLWAQTSQSYSQAYGGLTYKLTKDLQIGGGAGVEQAAAPWRVAGFAYYTKGKYLVLAIGEKGGGGTWYLTQVGYKANSRVQFSLHSQRFAGTGPRIDVGLGKGFTLWGGYLLQPGRNTVTFALKKTFSF